MSYFEFLRKKTKGYSLHTLIRLEAESLFFGICNLIPTVIGIAMRAAMFRILASRCDGFPWIQQHVVIVHSDRITVGSNFGVNSHTYINGIGGLKIGDHVLVGSNVTISSGMHPIEGKLPPVFSRQTIPKEIVIEDDVWIGAGAVIMPGVRLAKGSVIGANAVVTKDTEEYSVMAGVPARKLRTR